jgi:competence protein ComEC
VAIKSQSITQFLIKEIEKQRKSLFLWSPVMIGAGIITYFTFNDAIAWTLIGSAVFFVVLAIAKSVHSYSKTGHTFWLFMMIITIAMGLFVLGYGLAKYRTDSLNTPMITKDYFGYIEGTIEKIVPMDGGKAKRVILNDSKIENDDRVLRVRLKTYHFKGNDWGNGDRVIVRVKLMGPSGAIMPGGFDFSRKAYFERFSGVGYTIGNAVLVSKSSQNRSYLGHIQSFRDYIGQRVYAAMTPDHAAIAQALLTGERDGMRNDDIEALRVSGLAHLLAISGLHIGLVAGCMFFFVRLILVIIPGIALRYPIKKWAAVCAIIIAGCYMVLAGATVPTVRAFIMTSLVLLAVILDRSALNLRLVALAAIIVMMTTPESVMGPSFVLSFAAVAALIVFYQGVGRQWMVSARAYHPLWRPFYYILGVIITSLVATLATAPFSVMFFNRFAVYSLLSNIGAMPIMAFIVMPFGLLSVLIIPFGLDESLWPIMAWGIDQIQNIAHMTTAMPHADLRLPSFTDYEIFLISLAFIWLLLWRGILKLIAIPIIIICFISASYSGHAQIMISEKMDAILIVDKSRDKLFLIGKMNKYLKENWLGSLGLHPAVDMLQFKKGNNIDSSLGFCDDMMCSLHFDKVRVAVIINPISINQACQIHDIVISRVPMVNHFCIGDDIAIIDRFDVWRHGATTVTFHVNRYDITTVK